MKHLTLLLIAAVSFFNAIAQKQIDPHIEEYIEKYKFIAITEQIRTGVPAAIKLAQGIHETNAGKSELCVNANNHFGIKCKNTWQGETYSYTDDAKDECFRKYKSDIESYHDHSDFLKNNKRYEALFALDITDYKAWASQLKAAGYATNPRYSQRLIETIERYDLNQYTLLALNRNKPKQETIVKNTTQNAQAVVKEEEKNNTTTAYLNPTENTTKVSGENTAKETRYNFNKTNETQTSIAAQKAYNEEPPAAFYVITERNGLKGFYARKGDILLEQAIKNKIRYAKLLELNDLKDEALPHDMFIYTERKHKKGITPTYIVQNGETLSLISQKTGVQLNTIRQLNRITEGFEPIPGEVINLQEPKSLVPKVVSSSTAINTEPNTANAKRVKEDEYIFTQNNKHKEITINQENVNTVYNLENDSDNEKTINSTVTEVKKVNIADEPAIEEIIANERNTNETNVATTTKQTQAQEEEENLTPFEKLKRHMDKTVQNASNTSSNNNVNTIYANNNNDDNDDYVTTPAKQNTNVKSNTNITTKQTTSKAKTYKVKKGDSLYKIAEKHKVTVNQLKKWNGLKSNNIAVGKVLKVSA